MKQTIYGECLQLLLLLFGFLSLFVYFVNFTFDLIVKTTEGVPYTQLQR